MLSRFCLSFVWVLALAGAVQADICTQIHDAERLEANLIDTNQGARPMDLRTWRAIQLNGMAMADVFLNDVRLITAIDAYVSSVQRLSEDPAGHASAAHRATIRYMMAASYDKCRDDDVAQRTPTDGDAAPTGAFSKRESLDWTVVVPLFVLVFVSVCAIIFAMHNALRLRRKRRQRHLCFVDVAVTSTHGNFSTKMLDISAVGAKIRLQDGVALPKLAQLTIDGQTHQFHVAWQNKNFAGVQFDSPLSGRFVLSVSKGVQKRSVADATRKQKTSGNASAARTTQG